MIFFVGGGGGRGGAGGVLKLLVLPLPGAVGGGWQRR